MEDISRELEREIAQAKPKPYKKDRKTRVLIVDDFGRMTSGEYLKKLAISLSGVTLVFFVVFIVLFQLYSGLVKENRQVKAKLSTATQKIGDLSREKEMLMARLVILGKKPEIELKEQASEVEKTTQIPEEKAVTKNELKIQPSQARTPDPQDLIKPSAPDQPITVIKPQIDSIEPQSKELQNQMPADDIIKNVSIEKITVTKDGANKSLLVRFDIRNISTVPGEVSGRIFTVLKPDNVDDSQWLVVPSASLKNSVPADFKKGQYFSIARFKTVKFRIKNNSDPDFFKKASIYIFNNQGDMIFEKLIDITEES
ncbi:MAG: hypothetical protein ABIJ31_14265 [Pseudomonadota bacterium]